MKQNLLLRILYILVLPMVLMVLFTSLSSGFGFRGIYIVLNQTMIPFVMAMGVSFTLIIGIFDLSVGAQVILAGIVGGLLARYLGFPGLVIRTLKTGILSGFIMGTVYRYLKIPTIVVSLGMTFIFEAISTLLTKGSGFVKLEKGVSAIGNTPYNFIIGAIMMVLLYIILYKTKFGYHSRALGNNDMVAISLGLDNNKIKSKAYIIGGLFYGTAAVLSICYAGSISAKMSLSSLIMLFPAIIAVLIGLQLKNIVDNFPVTILIGAFSITILFTGLVALGLPGAMQDFLTGVYMLVVMIISVNRSRMSHYLSKRKLHARKN